MNENKRWETMKQMNQQFSNVKKLWNMMNFSDKQICASGFLPDWILSWGASDKEADVLRKWSEEEVGK